MAKSSHGFDYRRKFPGNQYAVVKAELRLVRVWEIGVRENIDVQTSRRD